MLMLGFTTSCGDVISMPVFERRTTNHAANPGNGKVVAMVQVFRALVRGDLSLTQRLRMCCREKYGILHILHVGVTSMICIDVTIY